MKMYRLVWDEITEHEVIKETDKSITYIHPRMNRLDTERKCSEYHTWHNTIQEAIEYKLAKYKAYIEALQEKIDRATRERAEFLVKYQK